MNPTAFLGTTTYRNPTPGAIYAALAPVIPGLGATPPHEMVLTLASDGHHVDATWSYAPLSGYQGTRRWISAGSLADETAVWTALSAVMQVPGGVHVLTLAIPAEGPVTWSTSGPALQAQESALHGY